MMLKLSQPHTKLIDGPLGLVYNWKLENGYSFSVISLFSYFQRQYNAKYEILIINPKGDYIEAELPNKYTSSIDDLNETLQFVKAL